MLLKNKRAVGCGGSDGIGRACAPLLAQNGADITIGARNENKIISPNQLLEDIVKAIVDKPIYPVPQIAILNFFDLSNFL